MRGRPGKRKITRPWWSTEEEAQIQLLVEKYGTDNWETVHREFRSRNERDEKAIRNRYYDFLEPSLSKDPFTVAEENVLWQQYEMLGRKWTKIAKALPGRSPKMVRNQFFSICRRKYIMPPAEVAQDVQSSPLYETQDEMMGGQTSDSSPIVTLNNWCRQREAVAKTSQAEPSSPDQMHEETNGHGTQSNGFLIHNSVIAALLQTCPDEELKSIIDQAMTSFNRNEKSKRHAHSQLGQRLLMINKFDIALKNFLAAGNHVEALKTINKQVNSVWYFCGLISTFRLFLCSERFQVKILTGIDNSTM